MAGQNATSALADVLARTRPWADPRATERELWDWWTTYQGPWPGGERTPADVAAELAAISTATDLPADVTDAVAFMLANAAAGRAPTDYALPISGIAPRTLRRYRHEPGPLGPLRKVFDRVNRQQSMGALVTGGWTPSAARRLLERHPGWHAALCDGRITWTPDAGAGATTPPTHPR